MVEKGSKKDKKPYEPKLTQNLSSSTLFYFTDELKYIIDSLEKGFLCRYHFEKFPLIRSGYIAPMKCFCDTPLSLIKPHLSWYGNYGIGIDKKYGRENGITPVFYMHPNSSYINSFRHSIVDKTIEQDPLLAYYKKYSGMIKKDGLNKQRRFYDEREWRYVPTNYIPLFYYTYDDKEIQKMLVEYNLKEDIRFKFNLDAIEYIIVDKPIDLEQLLPVLSQVAKKNKITYENLVTKILTARQIRRDF